MLYQQLPPFNPVANGVRSTLTVPRWSLSLGRIVLSFPTVPANSINKATISEIVVKIGARVVFGPISGAMLDKLNKFRGIQDDVHHLTIDFTERDGLSAVEKEVGAFDLPALGNQDVFVEVVNTAASGTPYLSAFAGFTALQFNPAKPNRNGQLIHKLIPYIIPNAGGTSQTWAPSFGGAIIKRVHFSYTGTDWSATADGNLKSVYLRKNGVSWHDNVRCLDQRFILTEQRKVPQSKVYHLDFVHDNVARAALQTRDARSLQFDLTTTAADTITAFVEALDVPNNL